MNPSRPRSIRPRKGIVVQGTWSAARRAPPRLVMLDLDGTLVDSVPDLSYCVDRTLEALGLPVAGSDRTRQWVGSGIEGLLRRALADACGTGEQNATLLARALEHFHPLYAENTSVRSRLYPGVREGLDYLESRGVKLACITNKSTHHARRLLADFGLLPRLTLIVGGDTLVERKPAPDPLRHVLRELRFRAGEALFVGDSFHDVSAARAAGVRVVCVSYGYSRGRDIREARPDAVIASLVELRALLDGDRPFGEC